MVRLTRIYTKTGDKGATSLGNGARVPKQSLRVEAYGTVDEANAAIGLARLHVDGDDDAMLSRIQNDLFDLGADLCTPATADEAPGAALRVAPAQTKRLEDEIDSMNALLQPLNSFILPGGSPAAAHLHLARTIVRRAERLICALAQDEPVGDQVVAYVNRLSDHLFVMARRTNRNGGADVLWTPGANR